MSVCTMGWVIVGLALSDPVSILFWLSESVVLLVDCRWITFLKMHSFGFDTTCDMQIN